MPNTQPLPPVALIVSHTVADFDIWKTAFDAEEDNRRSATVVGHHINRGEDDPNALGVYLAATDIDSLRAFASSDELKAVMAGAGVTSAPEMVQCTTLRVSRQAGPSTITTGVANLRAAARTGV